VAEVPTVAYELSRDALDEIETHDPAASTAFHAAIIRGLGDRMEYQNGLLTALLDRSEETRI
jgi:CRP-like cAMP-binding protein